MGRPGKSKRQRKERAAAAQQAQQDFGAVPHSFVFHRGRVGRSVRQLGRDLRRVMEPYTARALRVRRQNSLRDFVAVAGPLGVTHFLLLTKSCSSINLKLFRLPGGPTLTFKVTQYSLLRDVVSSLRRHRMHEQQFNHPPLLVLSNLGLPQIHLKVMATAFQNMLPTINVHRVNLNTIKRCLLLSYDAQTQLLEFRHYSLKVVPVGLSRGLKKLLQDKLPNMSRLEDISDLLVKDIPMSGSEAELEGPEGQEGLELPQACAGRGNMRNQQSAVRLTEIGPRMTLQLIKIEEGLAQGNVLYHSLIHKEEEEVQELLARKEQKLKEKEKRRQKQEEDVERKRQQREAHRARSLAGMRRKRQEEPGGPREGEEEEEEEEDEAEYFRQEVGEEPDKDLFPPPKRRRLLPVPPTKKRQKKENPTSRGSRPPGGGRKGSRPPRGTKRPPREGPGGPPRPSRAPLIPKGTRIFQRPGRTKKGKR